MELFQATPWQLDGQLRFASARTLKSAHTQYLKHGVILNQVQLTVAACALTHQAQGLHAWGQAVQAIATLAVEAVEGAVDIYIPDLGDHRRVLPGGHIRQLDHETPRFALARLGSLAFRHPDKLERLATSPDGQHIATAGSTQRGLMHRDFRGPRLCLETAPGELETWWWGGSEVCVWSADGALLHRFLGRSHGVIDLAFSYNSRWLACIHGVKRGFPLVCKVWKGSPWVTCFDLQTGKPHHLLKNHALLLAFHPREDALAVATTKDTRVFRFQADAWTQTHVLDQPLTHLCFSSDGRWLVGSQGRDIHIWHADTADVSQQIKTKRAITQIAPLPGKPLVCFEQSTHDRPPPDGSEDPRFQTRFTWLNLDTDEASELLFAHKSPDGSPLIAYEPGTERIATFHCFAPYASHTHLNLPPPERETQKNWHGGLIWEDEKSTDFLPPIFQHPSVTRLHWLKRGGPILAECFISHAFLQLDLDTQARRWRAPFDGLRRCGAKAVAASAQGRVAVSDGIYVHIWRIDGASREQIIPLTHGAHYPERMVFSPNGDLVAMADISQGVHIVDLKTQTHTRLEVSLQKNLAFDLTGTRLAVVTSKAVEVFSVDGTRLRQIPLDERDFGEEIFWISERRVWVLTHQHIMQIDVETGAALKQRHTKDHANTLSLDWSLLCVLPDGRLQYLERSDWTCFAFVTLDPKTLKVISRQEVSLAHHASYEAVSPDGSLVAGHQGEAVVLYERGNNTPRFVVPAHLGEVESLSFSPCGRYLVSGGAEGTAVVWQV